MKSKYWKEEDLIDVEKATKYKDLSVVALRVLSRMPQPTVEVCGPISSGGAGSIEKNLERFDLAIKSLQKKGIKVFNLMPFETSMHAIRDIRRKDKKFVDYDYALLEDFYLSVFESGYIKKFYMLPDWQSSTGATWEHEQAKRLGIETVYL